MSLKGGSYQNVNLKIDITLPALTYIESSAKMVNINSKFSGTNLNVKAFSASISFNEPVTLSGTISATLLGVEESITLKGTAQNQNLTIKGSGNID